MRYFWLILTITAVGWYIFVTAYVSFKGIFDIKEMLKTLGERKRKKNPLRRCRPRVFYLVADGRMDLNLAPTCGFERRWSSREYREHLSEKFLLTEHPGGRSM